MIDIFWSPGGWNHESRFWWRNRAWISWCKGDIKRRTICVSWPTWVRSQKSLYISTMAEEQPSSGLKKANMLWIGSGSCKRFISNQVRLWLFVPAYNLGNFLRWLVLPKKIKHWSLRSLPVKLIKIGAKIVRHSRYITFQIAEVSIDERLFAEILSRIERLRCYSV